MDRLDHSGHGELIVTGYWSLALLDGGFFCRSISSWGWRLAFGDVDQHLYSLKASTALATSLLSIMEFWDLDTNMHGITYIGY
jgi:hypothetical protein